MTDRYYRLITILVNVCPDPLRELFLKHAKADTNQTTPYTTLDAYLTLRKTDIKKLKSRKLLRQDQWNLIFPQQGQVNINQWDITLLSLLLKELFPGRLQPSDKAAIDNIRDIRNNLQHISGTAQITDSEFTNICTCLQSESIQIAHSAKGKTFADKIKKDIETTAYSVTADLGDVLREWYTAKNLIFEDELQQLKEQTNKIQDDAATVRNIITKASVKRVRSCGKVMKRLNTVNHILERMRESFKALLRKHSLQDELPDLPPEATRIAPQLKKKHLVVVSGFGESPYQRIAISVIDTLKYDHERCAVIVCPSDWLHISADDIELVVFLHPFGIKAFDKEKAKQMHTHFDSIRDSTVSCDEEDSIDVVIVTDQRILDKCKRYYSHEVIENPIVLYKLTAEDNPVDLVAGDTRHELRETDPHYKNLLVQSTVYCKHHRGQFTDDELFKKALEEFRSKKVVVISGPRGCGKTSLALKLLSSYEGHYLILTEPDDLAYIRFGMTCVVVIEDLGGKWEVEKSVVQKWFQKFDMLHAAVKDGKLNVIVTCDFDRLNSAIPATYRHPLLESIVAIPTLGAVKVKEEPTTDEQAQSQGIYRRISFSTARTDSKKLSVPVWNNSYCRFLFAPSFSQFRDGSFLFIDSMFSTEILHFSSDLEYIRSYRVNENFDNLSSVHCTDGGDVLTTNDNEVKLYRLSDESCTLKQSICLQEYIVSVYSNINEIYVICNDELFVLNEKLEKCRTVEHFPIDYVGLISLNLVFLQELLFHIDDYRNVILFEYTKVKEIKFLKKEDFRPRCLCAANDNSVFVLGRQGDNDSRILQVDTKMNVLSDITITNKKYTGESNMIFDRANARLITFDYSKCELIYLK